MHAPRPRTWLAAIAVCAMSLILRPGATSIGPLLAEISHDLALTPLWSGLVAALPGICFALFGAVAVPVASRRGLAHTLALGAGLVAVGLLARTFSSTAWIFVLTTVVAYAGMAWGNVLVPAYIKRTFPHRVPTIMSVYATVIAVGATLGSATAGPVAKVAPGGWRSSLGMWGLVALATLIPWVALSLLGRRDGRPNATAHAPMHRMAASKKAVALGLFFGSQSMQAYVQFGWLPQILRDGGLSQTDAGLAVALISVFGIPAGMVIPWIVEHVRDIRWIPVVCGALLIVGYGGIWLAPTAAPYLWASCLGLSGWAYPLVLALTTARTRSHVVTAQVSGFTQSIGYVLAAAGPFIIGAIYSATHSWTAPLALLAAMSVVMAVAGWFAAGPGYIDDELPTPDAP